MATLIDALVVELGFDTSGMEAGRKKVEDTFKKTKESAANTGKTIENSSKQAGEYMTRLRNNVLGLFAAFTAGRGLKNFVGEVTTSNAELGRFSKTVDQSALSVASWRGAARLLGVDAKDVDSTFSALASGFQQFSLTGDSTLVPWFRALGMTMSDAEGHMRPINDMLLELSQKVQGMNPARATAILGNMGISPGMINLILQGPAAIQKLIDKQQALARAQAADAPAAAARQQAWEEFLSTAEAIGNMLLTTLTPAIIALTNAGKAFAAWGERHPALVEAAFVALTAVVLALSGAILVSLVGSALAGAVAGFGALLGMGSSLALGLAILTETALPALSVAFLALGVAIEATPIGWIITGIAAISVAGYELVKHWDDIANWWSKLWGRMEDGASEGSDKIQKSTSKLAGKPEGKSAKSDINFFVSKGYSREQAIGIVSNLQGESGGKTDAVGDNGQAFGLAQWHPDRQRNFAAWAGHDIRSSTREEQLGFIDYELRTTHKRAGDLLRGASDARSASNIITQHYEKPANIPQQSATRAAIAEALAVAPSQVISPAAVMANVSGGNRTSHNTSTSDTRIGEVKIITQATDARGIARDFKGAMAEKGFGQQANAGPV